MVPVNYWSNHSHAALGRGDSLLVGCQSLVCTKVYMIKDKRTNEYKKVIFSLYFKLLDSSLSLSKKKSRLIIALKIV